MRILASTLLAGTLISPAMASDGVLEINQTCALETGCFPDDAPGFPVTLSRSGSYRLTGNLDLTFASPSPTAIEVTSNWVTIDLGGFTIRGSTVCSGGCSPVGTGHGIDGGGFTGGPTRITVRNGYIEGMSGHGVNLGNSCRVHDITAIQNGLDGIAVQTACMVTGSYAAANGDDGIDVDDVSHVVDCIALNNADDGVEAEGTDIVTTGTTVYGNGGHGIERQGRVTEMANACDDGSCSRRGERRYYLTRSTHSGAGAATSSTCAPGFHFGSIFELKSYGAVMQYDTFRGVNDAVDQGAGPPTGVGTAWVRTGEAVALSSGGNSNCNGWTSSSSGTGSTVSLEILTTLDPGYNEVSGFERGISNCFNFRRVLSIED